MIACMYTHIVKVLELIPVRVPGIHAVEYCKEVNRYDSKVQMYDTMLVL